MHAEDAIAVALLADEAVNPGDIKLSASSPMIGDDVTASHHPHRTCHTPRPHTVVEADSKLTRQPPARASDCR